MRNRSLAIAMGFILGAAIPAASLAAPSSRPAGAPAEQGKGKRQAHFPRVSKPKLVAIIVVDQFAFEGMQRMEKYFGKTGLARLLSEGKSYPETYYAHQNTYTGPGHTTIATGSYAHLNGITANKYYDSAQKKTLMSFADSVNSVLDAPPDADDEPSPVNINCESLGDRLRLSTGMASKIVALGLKDRGAVPLGGKLGQTYWFSESTGAMTSSTYYMKELPSWVKQFNERKLPESYFGKNWDRILPADAYAGKDDVPWEEDSKGLGRTFPHPVNGKLDKPGASYYSAFATSPFGMDYTIAFAKAAVEAEKLGRRNVTDLLAVTFSSYDYVGHLFGPDSHEQQDMTVRVDRAIGELVSYLEKAVGGKENLLVGFIADHGATPVPEYSSSVGLAAGRIKKATIKDAINSVLVAKFGAGEWVVALEDPNVFLNRALISEKKLDPSIVEETAGQAIMKVPGFLKYFTRSKIMQSAIEDTALGRAVQLSYYPERSGDIVLVTKPYYFWGKYGEKSTGSTHGSPYRYDAHVPMIFWGAGVKAGVHNGRAEPVDFAITLASMLGIDPPSCAEGIARE